MSFNVDQITRCELDPSPPPGHFYRSSIVLKKKIKSKFNLILKNNKNLLHKKLRVGGKLEGRVKF